MTSRLSRVRVYLASSLDGFIAGANDDLSWLPDEPPEADPEPGVLTYEAFIADVGALLMGRRTYDVVQGFGVEWPWGDRPVLVASHRELDAGAPETARRVEGPIAELVRQAQAAAGGRDVYLDGGVLIRQACEAGLVDDLTITLAPVALGSGHPLFAGLSRPYAMKVVEVHRYHAGMIQLRLEPMRPVADRPAHTDTPRPS